MGVKLCPECHGDGFTLSYSDDKLTCSSCNGSGCVKSSDPDDEWNEAVVRDGRVEIKKIDITK